MDSIRETKAIFPAATTQEVRILLVFEIARVLVRLDHVASISHKPGSQRDSFQECRESNYQRPLYASKSTRTYSRQLLVRVGFLDLDFACGALGNQNDLLDNAMTRKNASEREIV
jgi:hypothetical protein